MTKITVQLHVVVYTEEDGSTRFRIWALGEDLVDVTDQYEVAATTDPETGRNGFVILRKEG